MSQTHGKRERKRARASERDREREREKKGYVKYVVLQARTNVVHAHSCRVHPPSGMLRIIVVKQALASDERVREGQTRVAVVEALIKRMRQAEAPRVRALGTLGECFGLHRQSSAELGRATGARPMPHSRTAQCWSCSRRVFILFTLGWVKSWLPRVPPISSVLSDPDDSGLRGVLSRVLSESIHTRQHRAEIYRSFGNSEDPPVEVSRMQQSALTIRVGRKNDTYRREWREEAAVLRLATSCRDAFECILTNSLPPFLRSRVCPSFVRSFVRCTCVCVPWTRGLIRRWSYEESLINLSDVKRIFGSVVDCSQERLYLKVMSHAVTAISKDSFKGKTALFFSLSLPHNFLLAFVSRSPNLYVRTDGKDGWLMGNIRERLTICISVV